MEGRVGRGYVRNDGGAGLKGKQEVEGEGEGEGEGSWVSEDRNDISLRKRPKFLKIVIVTKCFG